MTDLVKTVQNTIKEHALIAPGDLVILGFSGGPDSLCLFHALLELKGSMGFELAAAHINHGIRGEAADEDMRWAMEYSAAHGVPCMASAADVPNYAKRRHLTEEEAGRMVRRDVFAYLAYGLATGKEMGKHPAGELLAKAPLPRFDAGRGSVRVALAHNLDDQAETVLMRIIRGTGTRGLSGIKYKSPMVDALMRVAAGLDDDELRKNAKSLDISIIRPLLDVPRTAIEKYCTENQLQPRIDHTNAETDYTRNRIRLELIPQIEKDYNPNFKETLVRLAANAAEDDGALSAEAASRALGAEKVLAPRIPKPEDKIFPASMEPKPLLSEIRLDAASLKALQPAVFKRVIVLEFEKLGLTEGISSVHLNALHGAVLKNVGGKTIEFPGGHSASLRGGVLTLR
ncbi:MAG: tRNA lysidine(34) synthetase TilS [Firmicutes bacterium]|nr:tRNA lysidine(34) synthetase TilS [Bacillota bacterium]